MQPVLLIKSNSQELNLEEFGESIVIEVREGDEVKKTVQLSSPQLYRIIAEAILDNYTPFYSSKREISG